jgi:integrase
LLRAVLDDQVRQGNLPRNVATLVDRPNREHLEVSIWTDRQAQRFLQHVADDRLYACWLLSLYGLRRGEVMGLRWGDIDLFNGTVTIGWSRGIVNDTVVEGQPKTNRSRRVLPLDDVLVDALTKLWLLQRTEQLRAGDAYTPPCDLADAVTGQRCTGDHVLVDEIGGRPRPAHYTRRFERLARRAGLPRIRLHDLRHTAASLLHLEGVPAAVVSAWLGHASAAFTLATYTHATDLSLDVAGQALRNVLTGGRGDAV